MRKEKSESEQLFAACEAAKLPLCGEDFLWRTLAILHCYGGGPGGESFRHGFAHAAAMKGGERLEKAVLQKDWTFIGKIRGYVRELQAGKAHWLNRTLDRLNIPAREINFRECFQPKSPPGC